MIRRAAITLLVVVAPALAQFQSNRPPRTGQKFTVRGTVVNAVTGEAIPRAVVQLASSTQRAMFTGADGRFEFTEVNEGNTMVMAHKPGFFNDQEMPQRTGPIVRPIAIGPDTPAIVVKLTPEAVITGHVAAADGEPLANAQVEVSSYVVSNGRRQWQPRGSRGTDDEGDFRVANLPPGNYYVRVTPSPRNSMLASAAATQGRPVEGFGPVYYPGAAEFAGAAPVALAAGQRLPLTFTLRPQPLYTVTGSVSGYQAGQFPNVMLRKDDPTHSGGRGGSVNPSTGAFEIRNVPAGQYQLRAQFQDGRTLALAEVPVVVAGNVTGVQLVMQSAQPIPIEVRTDFTKTDASRYGSPNYQFVNVRLEGSDPSVPGGFSQWSGGQDARVFAVQGAAPGRFNVEINPNGGSWYVQSARCGETDLLREPLVVTSGRMPPISIVLRDDAGSLDVKTNNAPADLPLMVLVRSESAPARPPLMVPMAQSGATSLGEMFAPGDYSVWAFDRLEGIEWRNPEVMKKYSTRAARVSIAAGSRASVTVDVIKAEP